MDVLFVIEGSLPTGHDVFLVRGGVEIAALTAALWMAQRHEIRVVTDRQPAIPGTTSNGIDVVWCGLPRGWQPSLLSRLAFVRWQ